MFPSWKYKPVTSSSSRPLRGWRVEAEGCHLFPDPQTITHLEKQWSAERVMFFYSSWALNTIQSGLQGISYRDGNLTRPATGRPSHWGCDYQHWCTSRNTTGVNSLHSPSTPQTKAFTLSPSDDTSAVGWQEVVQRIEGELCHTVQPEA